MSKIKQNIASGLTLLLIVAIAIPSSLIARPFNNDPEIRVYPDNEIITFAPTKVGETRTDYFTIENISNSNRTLQVTGNPASPFSYSAGSSFEVTANSTRSFAINFAPTREGDFESGLTLRNTKTNETKYITVRGTALPKEVNRGLEVSQSTVRFPRTIIGEVAQTRVTATNYNNFPLEVSARTSESRSSNPFRVENGGTETVLPGESYTVTVTFRPFDTKSYDDTLIFTSRHEGESKNTRVNLDGQGIEPLSPSNPELEINIGNTIDFGTVAANETSSQSIQVKNNGSRTINLNITNYPEFPFNASFSRDQIAPGQTARLRVEFKPEREGTFQSEFTIVTNADNLRSSFITVRGNALPKGNTNNSYINILSYASPSIIDERNGSAAIYYTVNQSATTRVKITRNGKLIKELRDHRTKAGEENKVFWDGTDSNKKFVTPGTYNYEIKATNSRNEKDTKTGIIKVESDTLPGYVVRPEPEFGGPEVTVSRATINPDMNEVAYFNLNTTNNTKIELAVYNTRNNEMIFNKNFGNITPRNGNWNVSWNGRNYANNKVSAGTYEFVLYANGTPTTGIINIVRNSDHKGQDFVLYFEDEPFYQDYNYTPPTTINFDEMIFDLTVNPKVVPIHNTRVFVSFNQRYTAPVTANILDANKNIVKTIVKNMPTTAGYKRNHIDWDTLIEGYPAPNGQYFFEVSTARKGESDTDMVPFIIERGEYVEQEELEPMGPAFNFYSQYYEYEPAPALEVLTTCLDFVDIEDGTDFCNAVSLAVKTGLIQGTIDENGIKTLRPDDTLTKSETAALIVRLLGIEPAPYSKRLDSNLGFKDLDTNEWYMPYFKTASQLAIRQSKQQKDWISTLTKGYPDGTIRPNQPISRADLYQLVLDAVQQSKNIKSNFKLNPSVKTAPFKDLKISKANSAILPYAELVSKYFNQTDFAKNYFESYTLNSKNGLFNAEDAVTRAEVIEFIYNLEGLNLIDFQ